MQPEFVIPEFLENSSTQEIFERMKALIPSDIDLSAGGHYWNMLYPSALAASEIREFILPEVIKLIFPEWSYGEFLDGHAKARSITRRAAVPASGQITITGTSGTLIPAGSIFATASINGEPSVEYESIDAASIPSDGSVSIDIRCTQAGTIGNTGANTIIIASNVTGITSVTNENPVTGGADEESDESLRERIEEYDKSQGDNFTGSVSDYKRWATSVPGVGDAAIIPASDDSGLVTIILTDSNGAPATEQLRNAVYNFIMRPDSPGERLAPINANLSVLSPSTTGISITATVELSDGASIESVKADFMDKLLAYLPLAMEESEIKYTRIAAALSSSAGVNDFKDLLMGVKSEGSTEYSTDNIPITTSQLPTVSEEDLILESGSV